MAVVIGIGLIITGFCVMKDNYVGIGWLLVVFGCGLMGAVASIG